jgi:DNA repair exonuclease SbcCD ATPase subunit
MENYDEMKHIYQQMVGQRDMLKSQLDAEKASREALGRRLRSAEKLAIISQEVARQTMEGLKFHIESIVTAALHAVFLDPPSFTANFEKVRNQVECYLKFQYRGREYDPIGSDGGGALDIASLALRLTYWSLKKNRPTFILDEPFKYVSVDLQEKCAAMIKMLSEKMGVQIIMVSHLPNINITADKEYKVEMKGGKSIVKEVK